MNQLTKKIISEFSPMWTNKQVWEFDQTNPELTFDLIYVNLVNMMKNYGNQNQLTWIQRLEI